MYGDVNSLSDNRACNKQSTINEGKLLKYSSNW